MSSTPKPSPLRPPSAAAGTSAISWRSAWRTLRPRAIRPSTGTPTLAARCSIASKTVNASSHARPTGASSVNGSGTVAR